MDVNGEEVRAVLAREDASGVREDAFLQLFALGCDCCGLGFGGERERVGVWWEEEDGCLEGAPAGVLPSGGQSEVVGYSVAMRRLSSWACTRVSPGQSVAALNALTGAVQRWLGFLNTMRGPWRTISSQID